MLDKLYKDFRVKNKVILSVIFSFIFLSSCNFPRLVRRYQTNNLKHNDFVFCEIKNKGIRHFYYSKNNKVQTIILIHGFGADGLTQWFKTAKLLSKNYNVIVPDLLNHGNSFDSIPDYSIEAQALYINQILDTLKISKVALLGNSYGGLVATEFAHLFPEKVSKLILNDAVNNFFSLAIADSAAQILGFKKVIEVLSPNSPKAMKKTLGIVYYKVPFIPNFILKQVFNDSFEKRQKPNENILQHLIDNEAYYHNRNYSFNENTFLVWGDNDNLIPLYTAKRFIDFYKLNRLNLITIPKAAHAPNMEHNKKFCKIVEGILQ